MDILQKVSLAKTDTTRDKAYLLNCYIAAYKITGDGTFFEQVKTLVEQLVSMQSDSGAWISDSKIDNEATASIVHAFRVLRETENGKLNKCLESAFGYALTQESPDIQILKILYEGFRCNGDEKFLDRIVELVSLMDVDRRVEGFLLLLMATDRMEYMEKALKIIKPFNGFSNQETVDFLLWDLSSFDTERYPKQPSLRRYIAEQIDLNDLKDLWRALCYIAGEANLVNLEKGNIVESPKIVEAPISVLRDVLGESVILGRSKATQTKLDCRGTMYIGCVGERKSEDENLLGCKVLLDAVAPHVIFIGGHRGSGKSYTMGVIAEELAEMKLGIATIIVDPMGIFWSMKYPNWDKRELETLEKWNLKPKGFSNVKVFVPIGFYDRVPEQTKDAPFSLKPSELTADDWCHTFSIDRFSALGLLTEQAIEKVKNGYKAIIGDKELNITGKGDAYTIDDLIKCIETSSDIISEDRGFRRDTRRALIARFSSAKQWGIFSDKGTTLKQLAVPNQVSVIDVSHLDDSLRALVIGILARRILKVRLQISRTEEAAKLGEATSGSVEEEIPVTWLMIDEAHLLVPSRGVTAASDPLIEYAKLGRKPGCGLVLVTQQPSATDNRILSQIDVLITHYLSYEPDIIAFTKRSPKEIPEEIKDSGFLRNIPIGTTIVSDESITSSRALVVKIRPRLSQHSGREALPKMVEGLAPMTKSLIASEKVEPTSEKIEEIPEKEAEGLEAFERLTEKEMVEVAPDVSIPAPPVLSLPTDLASDYLKRVLEYAFYDYLYPVPKMEAVVEKILSQADSTEVIREVYNKLKGEGWQPNINTAKGLPVILGLKDKTRLSLGVLENEENTIILVSSTSTLKNETQNIIATLRETINSLKTAPRKHPKPKPLTQEAPIDRKLPELPTPPPKPSVKAVDEIEPEIPKPLEEPVIEKLEEPEPKQEISREEEQERIVREIQKFQKYLKSLQEYFELGRMTEEEYIFLKRKTFEKIEQLRRSLIQ